MKFLIITITIFTFDKSYSNEIPNLKGTWVGKNNTLSNQRGFRTWEKK